MAVRRPRGLFLEGEPGYFRPGPILMSRKITPPSLFNREEKLQTKLPGKLWDSSIRDPQKCLQVSDLITTERVSLPYLDLVKNVQQKT